MKSFVRLRYSTIEAGQDDHYQSLADILAFRKIYTVFQPIFHLQTGDLFSYEALSRVEGASPFSGPEHLFQVAQRHRLTPELEKLCSSKALNRARRLGIEEPLSFNVCPSLLSSPNSATEGVFTGIEDLIAVRDRIILEITERYYIEDNERFIKAVDYYRDMGFRIAVDDLGSGFAGLKMLSRIEPFMVKIDRFLIADIHRSTKKQMLLESLVSFCHKINALVVAEGIETKEELEVVCSMQVDLGQGYFLGRPDRELPDDTRFQKNLISQFAGNTTTEGISGNLIGSLSRHVKSLSLQDNVSKVVERFKQDQTLTAIPVLEGRRPVGVIHKAKLFYQLGQRFGYDLFHKKPLKTIMKSPFVFESDTPLEEVSRKILARDETSVYDAVLVVRNGVYLGVVKIHHILERLTEQKINLAIEANPLTGLPGNNQIKEEIARCLGIDRVFAVMYFDLDNFKPFNDNFGFEEGDRVLRFLGNLLKDSITHWDPQGFVGHVGGDDFVAVCKPFEVERICKMIIERFDRESDRFHDSSAAESGYYESCDRMGNIQRFPLLSLSIGVVATSLRKFNSYGHLVSVASEVKKKAKNLPGSSYYVDKRRL